MKDDDVDNDDQQAGKHFVIAIALVSCPVRIETTVTEVITTSTTLC